MFQFRNQAVITEVFTPPVGAESGKAALCCGAGNVFDYLPYTAFPQYHLLGASARAIHK